MTPRGALLTLLAISALSLFGQLGVRGLNEPDEGRVVSIASEMHANHDLLIPRMYDHAHFNKPPLVYWFIMLCFSLGGATEWMARFPAACSALGTILLTAALARRLYGPAQFLTAGLVLLTCPLFFAMSQLIDYNMMLTFWVTLAFWSSVAWTQDGRPWQLVMFYAALALSFLTKGPVGVAIVALTLVGYRFRAGSALAWRRLWSWPLAVLALLVSLSWFVAVALKYPELWNHFLRGELYDRILTNEHHRAEPVLYYAFILPLAILPWLLLVVRSIAGGWRTFASNSTLRLTLCWIVLPLLMFTASKSKMPTYVLPLLPAFALLASGSLRLSRRALVIAALFMLVGYHGVLAWMGRHETNIRSHSTVRELARTIEEEARPGDKIALIERNPRGLSFYLRRPVSVFTGKFELQIEADRLRTLDKDFDNPAKVFRWFDSTQRVFLVCSERVAVERQRDAKNRPRELYRDSNLVLISNQ